MPNIELKPCPFCGGTGELKHRAFLGGSYAFIQCKQCHCTTDGICSDTSYCADEKAAEAWNRRADDEKP